MTSKRNGNGHMPEYAAKKPIAITSDGRFILPTQLEERAQLALGSLHSLETPLQQRLTLERIKLDPKYELGIFGLGKFRKSEVMEHVESLTDLGHMVIEAEINYCNEFASAALRFDKEKVLPTPKPIDVTMPPIKPAAKDIVLFVKNTALFVENTTDGVTGYAATYRKNHVHPVFAARGFKVVVLEGVDDNRANFAIEAKRPFVVYISGIGHGSPTTYTGHLGNPILKVGAYDPAEVRGKVIHLLSCQTARQLGPDVVAKGARAFVGYYENFVFVYDNPATGAVNEMELFWKCDSTFDLCMANGLKVEQAHNATIAAYNSAIAQVPNTSAATWLLWDRNYLRDPMINVIYGDKTATIAPYRRVRVHIPLDMVELEMEHEEMVEA